MLGWLWGEPALNDETKVQITGAIREHKTTDKTITIDLEIENTQTSQSCSRHHLRVGRKHLNVPSEYRGNRVLVAHLRNPIHCANLDAKKVDVWDADTELVQDKSIAPFVVSFQGSKYWQSKRVPFSSTLAPLSICRETIELKCKAGVSRFDADRYIKALIYHSGTDEKDGREEHFEWTYETMMTPFRDYAEEMPSDVTMTILLVGLSGAGKTALLRNLLTAGSTSRDISRAGAVASFGEHVTSKIEYYPMGELRDVQLVDIFGHAQDAMVAGEERRRARAGPWQQNELEFLLEGALPPGWAIEDRIGGRGRPALFDGRARRRHIPTSFIHVLDVREIDNDWFIEREAQHYRKLTQKAGFEGIICLTHIDKLVPEAREFPMETYPEIEELKANVARLMGAPPHTVYSVVSYTVERVRQYDIDRCSGVILEASMKQSLQFAKFHLDKRLRNFRDAVRGAAPIKKQCSSIHSSNFFLLFFSATILVNLNFLLTSI